MWNPYQNAQWLALQRQQQAYDAQRRQQTPTRPQPPTPRPGQQPQANNTDVDLATRMQGMGIGQSTSRAAAPTPTPATSSRAPAPRPQPSTDPNARQKPLQILDLPDQTIIATHSFAGAAATMGPTHPRRMHQIYYHLQMLKEKDALPFGIFVRYANSRPDVWKVLMIGPEDSPYENAIFAFDFFIPHNFPSAPPKMRMRTPLGGLISDNFNPNLKPGGQVCLSILNTWDGPGWDPAKCTLLQVLISVHSMVFYEKPWYNEPGFENIPDALGKPRSRAYNMGVWPQTVKMGTLDWLDGIGGWGMWDEVVKKHFEKKGGEIVKRVELWVRGEERKLRDQERARAGSVSLAALAQSLRNALPALTRNAASPQAQMMGGHGLMGGFGGIGGFF